jgi:hypothetical protein
MNIEAVAAHIVAGCVSSRKKAKRSAKEARRIAEFYWELVDALERSHPRDGSAKPNAMLREASLDRRSSSA